MNLPDALACDAEFFADFLQGFFRATVKAVTIAQNRRLSRVKVLDHVLQHAGDGLVLKVVVGRRGVLVLHHVGKIVRVIVADGRVERGGTDSGLPHLPDARGGHVQFVRQLLDNNDPRWLAFGFDLPGHTSGPDVPQNLTVTAGAAGSQTLYAHCDYPRRADGFRFIARNEAGDTVLAELLTLDAEATFNGLPSGVKVNLTVTARNTTGESQESAPPVVVVVP